MVVFLSLLMWFENHFVYFPTTAAEDWIETPSLTHEDVALALPDGTTIHAWWCPKPGADGAILYAHGNAGNLSHRHETFRLLQDRLNVSILAFDYPGYGKSGGQPSEAGCYAAGQAALDWLTTADGVPANRVILYGESLGGGVATELATRQPCRALVLFRSFCSVPDVARDTFPLLPARLLMRNRFNSLAKIRTLRMPIFINHGDADTIIRVDHARRLNDAAPEPKYLYIDPGVDHNDPVTPAFLDALRDFLKSCDNGSNPNS
jgi:hypothetical protein